MALEQPPVWVTYEYGDYAVILSGEADSVWAYMTHKGAIIADCIVLTTLFPPLADRADAAEYEAIGAPPPLTSDFASPAAYRTDPQNDWFRVLWSPEGTELLIAIHNQPHVYLNAAEELGYTRAVSEDCPFGQVWHEFPLAHINCQSQAVTHD